MLLHRLPSRLLGFVRLVVAQQRLRQFALHVRVIRRDPARFAQSLHRITRLVVYQGQCGPNAQPLHVIAARRHQLIGHGLRLFIEDRGMLRIAGVDDQCQIRQLNLGVRVLGTERDGVFQGLIGFAPLALLQQR